MCSMVMAGAKPITPKRNAVLNALRQAILFYFDPCAPSGALVFPAGLSHPVFFIATLNIMASQDLISQFTQDPSMIPASQSDRSRTPRRPHHEWHQPVPTFRGPMHYAMATRSTFLASTWGTTTATFNLYILFTPNVEQHSTKSVIPAYTSSPTSWTSGSHYIHTPEEQYHYTEITAVRQLATRPFSCS